MTLTTFLFVSLSLLGLFIYRIRLALNPPRFPHRSANATCSLALFLGSGGHTTEILTLISALDLDRYSPRTYILSAGDTLSAHKAIQFERATNSALAYTRPNILTIPRARRVGQSILTTPLTAAISLAACVRWLATSPDTPDVLLLNGPGTCVPLFIAVLFNRILGLRAPRVIYVESFARVKSLSISGKLLRPVVDSFIVQWPDALKGGQKGACHGWLV